MQSDLSEKTIENLLNLLEKCGPHSSISFGQDPKNLIIESQFREYCDKVRRLKILKDDWSLLPSELRHHHKKPTFTCLETRLLKFLEENQNVLQRKETTGKECRFCLSTDQGNYQSFVNLGDDLLDVVQTFFNISMFDGFPQHICSSCLRSIKLILDLRNKCKSSHQNLLKLAFQEIVFKNQLKETNDLLLLSKVSEAKSQMEVLSVANRDQLSNSDHDIDNFEESLENEFDDSKIVDMNKKHICEYCSKSFRTKLSLKVHIRSHTNERPFSCLECGKSFKTYSAVHNHRAAHSTEKKFKCPEIDCNYKTTTKANLNIHGRTHSKERKYTCDYCQFKFTTTSNLSKHVKNIHHQIKTHKCSQCEKTFFTKESARKHEVTHSNLKPYSCPVCSLSYAWYNGLQKHMKSVHPGTRTDTEKMYFDKIVNENTGE